MDNFYIAPTPSTPEVNFEFGAKTFSLRGESYPENAAAFYGDVIARLRSFLSTQQAQTLEVNVALAYFNSSSTKMLFNFIEALSDAAEAGNRVVLHWFHDAEDDTILEFGQELSEDFPAIEFVTHAVGAA